MHTGNARGTQGDGGGGGLSCPLCRQRQEGGAEEQWEVLEEGEESAGYLARLQVRYQHSYNHHRMFCMGSLCFMLGVVSCLQLHDWIRAHGRTQP